MLMWLMNAIRGRDMAGLREAGNLHQIAPPIYACNKPQILPLFWRNIEVNNSVSLNVYAAFMYF